MNAWRLCDQPAELGARYDSIGGGGGSGTDSAGDAWLRPPPHRPHRTVPTASRHMCSSSSSSSSSRSSSSGESDTDSSASPKRVGEAGRRHHPHYDRHGDGEGGVAAATDRGGAGVEEAPVVVGQGAGLRKGSGLFRLKGEGEKCTTSSD